MTRCRLACLSTRKLILPPLMSLTALATSVVTVPVFGFGIRPRGPRMRATRPTLAIWSGVAIAASKSRKPPWIRSIRSSAPTTSAPADSASAALSPAAKTMTRAVLPVPCGRLTVPRTIWSALRGSTPRRMATSTVASYVVGDVCLASVAAASGLYSRSRSTCSAAWRYFFPCFAMMVPLPRPRGGSLVVRGPGAALPQVLDVRARHRPGGCNAAECRRLPSPLDGDAHRPGGAGDDLLGLVEGVGVEVRHLGLRDLADLVAGHRGDLGLVRLAGALLHPGGLEQHLRGRRRLGDEGERPVFVDRDLDRDDVAALGLGRGVVRLAELHDVDAVLAQRRTDRRGRGRRAGVDLELDDRSQPLPGGHVFPLVRVRRWTWLEGPVAGARAELARRG